MLVQNGAAAGADQPGGLQQLDQGPGEGVVKIG